MKAKAAALSTAYGELIEVGGLYSDWPYAKLRPQAAPRAHAQRRAAANGATYTEEDVRARARAAGRDENAAVDAARKAGLIRQ